MSYTGDAADGDFGGFAKRAESLFRTSAPMVFTAILWWVGRGAPLPRRPHPSVTKRPAQRPVKRQGQERKKEDRSENDDIPDWRPAQRSFWG